MRWTFGNEPLAQTERVATLLRDVAGLVLALETEHGEVERLIGDLERAVAELGPLVPSDLTPRVGPAASGAGRIYLDHARDIGAYDPAFPTYELRADGDRATGTVTFPLAYEGPPGIVHGGFLGVFFDCAVQHHSCDVGVAGKTTSMLLRYRRPAPLLTELAFTIDRSVVEDRIRSEGELRAGDRVLCEAVIEAVAGDRANLPEVSARRSEP